MKGKDIKKMPKKRKILIIITSIIIVILVSLIISNIYFFKNDASYAMKVNNTVISPQVYNAYLVQKTILAQSKVPDFHDDFLAQKIDGKSVLDWIETSVREQIIYDCIIKEHFKKEQIKIYESDKERLATYLEQLWEVNESIFKINNCDRKTFDIAYDGFLYTNLLFDQYSKDNPEFNKDSISPSATAKYFIMNKYGLEGNKFAETQVKELIDLAKDYVKQLKGKKSMDEIYKNYLVKIGEELLEERLLTNSIISADNTEYTSKIPKFVKTLMDAKTNEPFYVEDEYYITIGIRQRDTDNKTIQKAYEESAKENVLRQNFERYINESIKKADIKMNDYIVKKCSPSSIQYATS